MKAVLFDCDGVLINSEEVALDADRQFLAGYGLVFSQDEFIELFSGVVYEEMIKTLDNRHRAIHGSGLPSDFEGKLVGHYRALEQTRMTSIDGVVDLLQTLQRMRVPFAVASNSGIVDLVRKLKLTALHDYFAPHIYSKDHVAMPKPAPDLYLHAAQKIGFRPSQCIVIEDSITGVKAGAGAGMHVLGYAGGSHRSPGYGDKLEAAGAQDSAYKMSDIKALILQRIVPPSPPRAPGYAP